jgi:transglutaminase superfamily protein
VTRTPLPDLVAELARPARTPARRNPPERLGRAVNRSLRLGDRQPTCLVKSLVLFRLLREQGDQGELVIGLPDRSGNQTAHAWVELDGTDVGPPPGRGPNVPLARFR